MYSISRDLLDLIAEQGLDVLPELMRIVINHAMLAERQQHLQAQPYERTEKRQGYANGFKPKTVTSRLGAITFDVPQVRDSSFYPQALEKGLRSERAFTLTLAEMYVQGVSTRKVSAITEQLCGVELSSSQVSRAAAQLDQVLENWRNRPLSECRYLYLDARYEKVRIDGQVRDVAVLIALGVTHEGKRTILGISVSLSEQEAHWRSFLQSLLTRGLRGVQLIVSDAHAAKQAARKAVFGGIPWQRCQFHLQQNAQAFVVRQELKAEVAADIRAIFNAPNRDEANLVLKRTVEKYQKRSATLAAWLELNRAEGLTAFAFPEPHQRLLRTTNGLERLNREIRRRTRVVGIFPNEASCLRLVSALAMETSEEWEAGKRILPLQPNC